MKLVQLSFQREPKMQHDMHLINPNAVLSITPFVHIGSSRENDAEGFVIRLRDGSKLVGVGSPLEAAEKLGLHITRKETI